MRARPITATAGALLLALTVGFAARAEDSPSGTSPSLPSPTPPDGFYVTPPRPVPLPLMPDVRARGGPQPNLPQQAPQGGCPYNGRKLDLIV